MSTPAAYQNPRQRFQASATATSAHRAMVSSDAFTVSADAAMLQYVYITAASATDANSSVMAAQRVKGAQDFLELLKTLAETPKPMGSIIRDHLPE